MNLIQELERFFELDLKVKKLLETSRPNTYDKDPVEIEKDLLNVLKISKNAIIQMAFLSKLDVADDFYDKLEQIKLKINNCNFNVDKLIDVYEKNILNLSKGLEESLEKNIGGYDTNEEIYVPLRFCNTVNDMLHYLHFYVLNDENVLHSMNVIESKINESDYYSVLYGKESEEARDVYNNLPNSKREGPIDVVSFDNHVIVMVRDIGHALTIDIQKENDNYRVYYFIPKTCNVEMINKLKGVKKLNPNNYDPNDPTHGEFVVSKENLGKEIGDLIKSVPSDMNIKREFTLEDFAKLSPEEREKHIQTM